MFNLSAYARSGLAYQTFLSQAFVTPTTLAVALCGPPPTVNSYTEVASVGSYVRQAVNAGATNWNYPYPNSGVVFNNNQITFPKATLYQGWVSGIAILDNTGYGLGNMWFWGPISPAIEINVNSQIFFSVSGLSVQYS